MDFDVRIRPQARKSLAMRVTPAGVQVLIPQDLAADSPEVQDFIVPAIHQYYEGRDWVQRDEVMRSCGIAAQTLMLAAQAMGYDSCPMDGFDYDAVGKLIGLPEDHVVTMFVVIGKGTKKAWPRPGQLPLDKVVIEDRFD